MNKGHAFAEFAQGRYVKGREILAQLAAQGDYYAQLLMARALFYGYWCIKRNRAQATHYLLEIANKGYAPAAAEAVRRSRFWGPEESKNCNALLRRYLDCIEESDDLYAKGVINIMRYAATRRDDLDDAEVLVLGRIQIETSATDQGYELAAADATWNESLQQRAAVFGFGDVQFHLGLTISAAAHHFVPALVFDSSPCREFLLGVTLFDDDHVVEYSRWISEQWQKRYLAESPGNRYLMGRVGVKHGLAHTPAHEYYRERRKHHGTLVCAFLVAIKRSPRPWLLRELRIMIAQQFFVLQDECEIIN